MTATPHQLRELRRVLDQDPELQYALGNRDGTYLMLGLVIQSGRMALVKGVGFEEWLGQIEAMLQEHRPQ